MEVLAEGSALRASKSFLGGNATDKIKPLFFIYLKTKKEMHFLFLNLVSILVKFR